MQSVNIFQHGRAYSFHQLPKYIKLLLRLRRGMGCRFEALRGFTPSDTTRSHPSAQLFVFRQYQASWGARGARGAERVSYAMCLCGAHCYCRKRDAVNAVTCGLQARHIMMSLLGPPPVDGREPEHSRRVLGVRSLLNGYVDTLHCLPSCFLLPAFPPSFLPSVPSFLPSFYKCSYRELSSQQDTESRRRPCSLIFPTHRCFDMKSLFGPRAGRICSSC